MNIIKYALLRIFAMIVQLIGAAAIIISATSFIPYDISVFFAIGGNSEDQDSLGQNARSREEIDAFKQDFGLEQSPIERFGEFLSGLFNDGDLGTSWFQDKPVGELYIEAFLTTMKVFGLGILFFTILAIIFGILSARRLDGTLDKNVRFTTSMFYSFPPYVLGTLLIFSMEGFFISSLNTKIFFSLESQFGIEVNTPPFTDLYNSFIESFSYSAIFVFLPVLTVVLIYTGFQFRLVRIYMSDVLNQNYIRTAHAKGLDERTILLKHGLRNALPELITSIATTFPVAFSGVVVLEKVFEIEGAGLLLIDSGLSFDWPVLLGGAIIFTGLNALVLTLTDLIVHYIDPQLRLR